MPFIPHTSESTPQTGEYLTVPRPAAQKKNTRYIVQSNFGRLQNALCEVFMGDSLRRETHANALMRRKKERLVSRPGFDYRQSFPESKLLFRRRLLLAIAGLDGSTYGSQHLLSHVGVGAGGLELEVLLESLNRSGGRHCFVALQGGFADKVYSFLIVGVGSVRVSRNGSIKSSDSVVRLAGIGQDGAAIVVVLRRGRWIGLGCQSVSFHCIVDLARLGIGFSLVVVVRRQVLGCVRVLVIRGCLPQLDGLLIGFHGSVQTL